MYLATQSSDHKLPPKNLNFRSLSSCWCGLGHFRLLQQQAAPMRNWGACNAELNSKIQKSCCAPMSVKCPPCKYFVCSAAAVWCRLFGWKWDKHRTGALIQFDLFATNSSICHSTVARPTELNVGNQLNVLGQKLMKQIFSCTAQRAITMQIIPK